MYGKKQYYNKYSKKDYKHYDNNKSKKNVHLSKFLSLVLRHKAKDFGLTVEPSGFIKLDDIISLPQSQKYHMTLPLIQEIVSADEKGRFELVNRPPYYIRAVQGHSMSEVTNEETMTKLDKKNIFDFPTVVHGTQEKAWKLIEKTGLNRMNRNAIHFSIGYNDENHVKSGMRLNCEIFIEINPQMAFFNGYEFFLSQYKVILCPGDETGVLPMGYVKKVKNNKNECVYSINYDVLIKYKAENEGGFEIFKDEKSLIKSNNINVIEDYVVDKELIKESVIVLVKEKDEEKYIKYINDGIQNGKIKYTALFVDYLIDNESEIYTSEFIKKVDIDWNKFYENKNYKNGKNDEDEDKKDTENKKEDEDEDEKDE